MVARTPTHASVPSTRAIRIAALNDAFRRGRGAGRLQVTSGIAALGGHALVAILALVRCFDAFNADNDPYGEHDFGRVSWGGQTVFWKIDCYDRALTYGSPDPADPAVTTRVLTVMLAEEY